MQIESTVKPSGQFVPACNALPVHKEILFEMLADRDFEPLMTETFGFTYIYIKVQEEIVKAFFICWN